MGTPICIDGKQLNTSFRRLPSNPRLTVYARRLRKAGNYSEVIFWKMVRNGSFYGIRFRRQKVIGNFITDFYCPSLQLVIEIDGGIHELQQEQDLLRESKLIAFGCKVKRFSAPLVINHPKQVELELKEFILENYT